MRSNRRVFLKTAALSAVVLGSSTGTAFASTGAITAIGTGLDTDRAFAKGAAAGLLAAPLASANGYQSLVEAMAAAPGSLFLALVEPAMALLVEEAAMDCRLAMMSRTAVHAPQGEDQSEWAHSIGRRLAIGKRLALGSDPAQLALTSSSAGPTYIALALR